MVFEIEVNNTLIKAKRGETILSALNRNGIYVPTLCFMEGFLPAGACRLCVVEVEGRQDLVPACSHPVEEWMKIRTHSPRVIQSRKTIIELLLSNHPDDCLYCVRNLNCELQRYAEEMNVTERRFSGEKNRQKTDPSSVSIVRDPAKCILCGRCIRICEEVMHVSTYDFLRRGSGLTVGTSFEKSLNLSNCILCGQCLMACPTGALHEKESIGGVQEALHHPSKKVFIQYSPSVAVTLAEEFGVKPGRDFSGTMNAICRKLGSYKVFETAFGVDLLVMEQVTELLDRAKAGENLPMFSSCCPGWVKYAEQYLPDRLGLLSTCKSPQQMMGALIKDHYSQKEGIRREDLYVVSVMPCTAKKFEAAREEMNQNGISDVDAVLTTREFIRLIRLNGIDVGQCEPEQAYPPYGTPSTAGKLAGVSGGIAEAMVRTAFFSLTGEELGQVKVNELRGSRRRREFFLNAGGITLGFAVLNNFEELNVFLAEVKAGRKDIHFAEVMACPGGCINGGGQPISRDTGVAKARIKTLYEADDKESIKVAHKNPTLLALYKETLLQPCGNKSTEILHTHYQGRKVLL